MHQVRQQQRELDNKREELEKSAARESAKRRREERARQAVWGGR